MKHSENLFKEFEAVSAEAWLARITSDLKGKDPESLNHHVGESIVLSPFHHADTMTNPAGPIGRNTQGNEWLIGEAFVVREDIVSTNKSILHALENGVQAVNITIDRALDKNDFTQLFDQVEPAYIHIHFTIAVSIDPVLILSEFVNILPDKKGDKNTFSGSVNIVGTQHSELQKWAITNLPNFKTWFIGAPFSDPVAQLTTMIRQGVADLSASDDADIVGQLIFKVNIGTDFFLEIARLRALRIVWANVLKSYKIEPTTFPTLMVEFDPSSQTEDANQNMIRATTMAMAAALGGADLLTVLPAGAESADEDTMRFHRRIARNVQHILKMESFIDRVKDVAGGSYYVETLTTKIGEAVWKNLRT